MRLRGWLRLGGPQRRTRNAEPCLLVTCWLLLASTGAAVAGKDAARKDAAPAPTDRIHLSNGTIVEGVLIDVLPEKVVLKESGKLRSFPQSDVKEIQRGLSRAFFKLFAEKAVQATTLKDWRKLASFCEKKRAYPEYRTCLRKIIRIEPEDQEAMRVLEVSSQDGGKKDPQDNSKEADEKFVKDLLETHLNPSTLRFLRDGRVHLLFDLSSKDRDQQASFTPHIARDLSSAFRWTRSRDETGEQRYGVTSTEPVTKGVKVADSGTAFLNCWFLDDVEATVDYAPVGTASKRQRVALVFGELKNHLVGNNLGTQCVTFKRGRPTSASGKVESVAFKETLRFKLVVRDGTFEARFEESTEQEKAYKRDRLKHGRVGFLWSGGAAGIIMRFEVVGKIDYRKTAAEIRGLSKKSGRKRG